MKKFLLFFVIAVLGLAAYSQTYLTGVVVDADTKEPLIGANVYNPATKTGAVTDLDGAFKLAGNNATLLSVSYMGYLSQELSFNVGERKTVELKSEVVTIRGAEIVADLAIARKTPIAVSTISPLGIEERLGTQEFPEILKTTPGVYATKQGGGFGDSRINLRGFESANIAVMINGVPVNDMEWGGVYWSNWAGLADVTRSMQVQRGLGASKVSAPSVGGSINIITKSTDAVKGGAVSYSLGNDGYNKVMFSLSTGLMSNGWAVTLLGAKTWGDGYIMGTEFSGYSYFANVSKQIGKKHVLSLTGFGAPQTHYQRYNGDQFRIGDWEKLPGSYKFNPSYGLTSSGEHPSVNYNYYHKPQISLNHYWDINEKSNLSTAVYVSIGRGGGYGPQGNKRNDMYGADGGVLATTYRTDEGFMNWDKIIAENAANPNGSQMAISSSTNEHNWYGLLSTYTTKFGQFFDFYGGVDLRYYEGIHQGKIVDLLGGAFMLDNSSRNNVSPDNNPAHNQTDINWVNEKLYVGDIVYRDNTGYVVQAGLFSQGEFNYKDVSAFVAASVNNSTYWKIDRFYYDNQKSKTSNFWGFTVKGGANYNINKYFNVFANIGYISRAPFMSGAVFTSIHTSNNVNENAVNEKVFSKEIGAGFRSKYFTANLNLYHTNWNDRTSARYIDKNRPEMGFLNLTGVDYLHMGIEFEAVAKPVRNLEIKAMFSLGDWRWNNNATGYAYNPQGQAIDAQSNVVDEFSPEHAKATLLAKGVHNNNSAQTTASLGASYKLFNCLKIGLDAIYYGRNYAYVNISGSSSSLLSNINWGETRVEDPWKIPEVVLLDLFASWDFNIGPFKASIIGNINNLLNTNYIADATSPATGATQDNARVMYGFGRTASITLKIRF